MRESMQVIMATPARAMPSKPAEREVLAGSGALAVQQVGEVGCAHDAERTRGV